MIRYQMRSCLDRNGLTIVSPVCGPRKDLSIGSGCGNWKDETREVSGFYGSCGRDAQGCCCCREFHISSAACRLCKLDPAPNWIIKKYANVLIHLYHLCFWQPFWILAAILKLLKL